MRRHASADASNLILKSQASKLRMGNPYETNQTKRARRIVCRLELVIAESLWTVGEFFTTDAANCYLEEGCPSVGRRSGAVTKGLELPSNRGIDF